MSGSFTPCRHLRPSSEKEHTMFERSYLRQCRNCSLFTLVRHYASREVSCAMLTQVCRGPAGLPGGLFFFLGGGVSPQIGYPPKYVDNDLQHSAAPPPSNVPDSPQKSENLQEALARNYLKLSCFVTKEGR